MSETPAKPPTELIASTEPLERLTDQIGSARVLALDTEFVRERTFFPELCLIQVATGNRIAAVDCLAGMTLSDFFAALGGGARPWVLHSSSQDLEILTQAGVTTDDGQAADAVRSHVLRSIDKLDRVGLDGVRALLGPGRTDDSGDFTAGVGLEDAQIEVRPGE